MGIQLRLANASDRDLLGTMYRDHLIHLSRTNPTVNTDIEFEVNWFENPGVLFPWLIEDVDGEGARPVGFALMGNDRLSRAMGSDADFLVFEFHVVEGARRGGVGSGAVAALLKEHCGSWCVDVDPGNELAMGFWTRVLAAFEPDVRERIDKDDGARFLRHTFDPRSLRG